MTDAQTILPVVKRKLCTGCGACAGVCPQDAIKMTVHAKRGCYFPRLDDKQCTRCGLCLRACPGHEVDFESFNGALFGDIPEDIALGRYLGCYVGHALDREVRYDCSSGGLVSALLAFALEEGLIDGALVTRMRQDDPLRPEPFIARTRAEVRSAAGSKYCPVAAGTALSEILRTAGRFAVVGLPCHIQGIRKAEQCIPALRERIRYRIAIPCSLNYSFRGTERILRDLGIRPDRVAALQYRGRGWPGTMLIRLKNGHEQTVPLAEYYRKLAPYSLRRCTLCSDMLGELSDLTCGDAWIPEVMQADKVGSSFAVTRTAEAEVFLEAAASMEVVQLSELDPEQLLASQGHALFKKRTVQARMQMSRWTGRSVPVYKQRLLAPVREDYVNTAKFYAARYALSGNRRILAGLFRLVRSLNRRKLRGRTVQTEVRARDVEHHGCKR